MKRRQTNRRRLLTRRQALTAAAAAASVGFGLGGSARAEAKERLAALLPDANTCILTPQAMAGPFYFDPKLVRAEIAEGKQGAPLKLALKVVEASTCAPLQHARLDVWHCDALGMYSGYAGQATGSAEGKTFLRGTQFTDADGLASFETIYPGWYPGRTPHIHFKAFLDQTSLVTGQLYFPDSLTERIYAATSPYRERAGRRDTFNETDFIFAEGGADTMLEIRQRDGTYSATLIVGVGRRRPSRG